uniref:Cysteine hydrolase n=2 Tax=Hirondellea gigas TaxID=1518452 RepID=A0A6A7G788_9CRUS
MPRVKSRPYLWPFDGNLHPSDTALIVIDMQHDFCAVGGYIDLMGYDVSLTQAVIKPLQRVLEVMRLKGFPVIHTRQGVRSDLSDLSETQRLKSRCSGAEIGQPGPNGSRNLVRGEPGWQIIPELTPRNGEPIIDKAQTGAFYGTDLGLILLARGIRNLIFTGITTDVCVHSTMRQASDRGYDCLLLEDCCAATDLENHKAAVKMITMEGGIFGAVSDSQLLIELLESCQTSKL